MFALISPPVKSADPPGRKEGGRGVREDKEKAGSFYKGA